MRWVVVLSAFKVEAGYFSAHWHPLLQHHVYRGISIKDERDHERHGDSSTQTISSGFGMNKMRGTHWNQFLDVNVLQRETEMNGKEEEEKGNVIICELMFVPYLMDIWPRTIGLSSTLLLSPCGSQHYVNLVGTVWSQRTHQYNEQDMICSVMISSSDCCSMKANWVNSAVLLDERMQGTL